MIKFSSSPEEAALFADLSSATNSDEVEINSDEVDGDDEYEKHDGRVAKGKSGVVLAITDSSELEDEYKFLGFNSEEACAYKIGGFLSVTEFSNSVSEILTFGLDTERDRTVDSTSEYRGGFGWSDPVLEHQLRIAVFRAKLGITVEKSGVEPSGRVGVRPKSRQTLTQVRSNVWPEDTTAGSDIRDLEIGQRNSGGGGLLAAEEDLWKEIRQRRNFPFPPIWG